MNYKIETNHPIAYESFDHIYPHGTIRDNFSNTLFIKYLNSLMRPEDVIFPLKNLNKKFPYNLLDIGCSGGGFVKEISESGVDAIGVEGSDISKKTGRAEWATIPERLFTCDVTKPFSLYKNNEKINFDVVTAWEVFEHFEKEDLPRVMDNINSFTVKNSLLICSIANFSSAPDGIELHRTRESEEWWINFFRKNNFERDSELEIYFRNEWVRHGTFNFVLVRTK